MDINTLLTELVVIADTLDRHNMTDVAADLDAAIFILSSEDAQPLNKSLSSLAREHYASVEGRDIPNEVMEAAAVKSVQDIAALTNKILDLEPKLMISVLRSLVQSMSSVLAPGQTRAVAEPVKIKLPRTEEGLQEHNITSTIGYIFSANLAGKYRVDLLNPSDMATVVIKATTAAKQAYEAMPYKLILEIYDGDARSVESAEPIRRNLIYNFPAEYLRNGEIEPKGQQPITARFKLFPLSAGTP